MQSRHEESRRDQLSRYVVIDRVPKITLPHRAPISSTEKRKFEAWIQSLAHIDQPGFGYSKSMEATTFPPVPEVYSGGIGALGVDRPVVSSTMALLASAGPRVLSTLLNELTNCAATQLQLRAESLYEIKPSFSWNPFSRRECMVLPELQGPDSFEFSHPASKYTVTVGDLCFVASGQIVGRSYNLVRGTPSPLVFFSRPSYDSRLCAALRCVWQSDRPEQMLLDSLLLDFSARARLDGKTDDFLWLATDLQTNAAVRMLYYYPDVAIPLVAKRLDTLDVRGIPEAGPSGLSAAEGKLFGYREQRNGVDTAFLVKSVAWCRDHRIIAALQRIAARSTDKEILGIIRH